jgi:hypothetical protein
MVVMGVMMANAVITEPEPVEEVVVSINTATSIKVVDE